jgi:hypothetical protein
MRKSEGQNVALFCATPFGFGHSDLLRQSIFVPSSFPRALTLTQKNFCVAPHKSIWYAGKHASSHLVSLCWLPRGLCCQGAHAYASIDHLDGRAWHCRLAYRRRCNAPVLPAQRRREISPRRINCINHWSDFGFVHLAQVQVATAPRISPVGSELSLLAVPRARRRVIPIAKLTWASSILGWSRARSRFPNCEKRPLCLHR